MAETDEDRLRALRARQQGGAYQEAPLPAAAQQKLAAAGAGRNIRPTGTSPSGAGPSRAVSEPAVRKDQATGKAVINLNTAVEADSAARAAKERAVSGDVHRDIRAAQSPLYNQAGPAPDTKRPGLGAATNSDTEWESQVKAVSAHIAEHHPHGGIGGVAVEHTQAGVPKPLSKDKITDLAERHLMGSARVPGLKAKSHEAIADTDQPGLKVSPAAARQSNNALKPAGGGGAVSLTTGNEDKTPIPSKYQGKGKTPVKTTQAAPPAPVAPSRPERTPRDFSGMTSRASAESRHGRRLERAAEYSESAAPGQSKRDYYESNVPATGTQGSKTAQEVLHNERLSTPLNHGQFSQTAAHLTSAVHSGLAAQTPPEPKAKPTPAPAPKAEAPTPAHQTAVESSPQLGTPGKLTMLTKPGTKGVTPPHMASSAPGRYYLSPQQANKARKSAPVAPEAEVTKPEVMAPPARTAAAPAPPAPAAPLRTLPKAAPVTPEAPPAPARRPSAPVSPAPVAAPAVASVAPSVPKTTKPLPETPRPAPQASAPVPEVVPAAQAGQEPSRSRSPRAAGGTSPTMGKQFGDVHHHHYYGNVNQGGVQINGNVGGSVSDISVGGGGSYGGRPSGSGRSPGRAGRGQMVGGGHPVTGTPTGLQRAAYTALHTSVNGHSIAGAVEHVTGGGHIGMEDSAGRPIGHPGDEFVRHHESNRPQQTPVNAGQFNQARASRQQATP